MGALSRGYIYPGDSEHRRDNMPFLRVITVLVDYVLSTGRPGVFRSTILSNNPVQRVFLACAIQTIVVIIVERS